MKPINSSSWMWNVIVVILFLILMIAMILSLNSPQRGGWLTLIALVAWMTIRFLRKDKIALHPLLLLGFVYGMYLMIPKSNEAAVPIYYFSTVTFWMVLVYGWMIYDITGGYFKREHWENAVLILGAIIVYQMIHELVDWHLAYQVWASSQTFETPNIAYRVSGGFTNNVNVLAAFLNAILPLALLRVYKCRSILPRIVYSVFLILIFIILINTNSRGGILGTIAMGGLILIYAMIDRYPTLINKPTALWTSISRRDKAIVGGFLLIGLFLVGFIFWRATLTGTQSVSFQSRNQIWGDSIAVFLNSPLFGNGAGSFVLEYARKAGLPPGFLSPHAHNLEIQTLVISGIIGLIFLLSAIALIIYLFLRVIRKISGYERTHFILLSMFLVGMLVHNQFDYSLEGSPTITIVYIILMALVLHFDKPILVTYPGWIRKTILGIFSLSFFVTLVGITAISKGQAQYTTSQELIAATEWEKASLDICDIAMHNTMNQFYAFQCSQLKSLAGIHNKDEQLMSEALQVQVNALDANPWWPIHRANFAGLLWWHGEYERAFEEMQIAVDAAEHNVVLNLNYGLMAEQLEQTAVAKSAFFFAMILNPYLIGNSRYEQSSSWNAACEQIIQAIYSYDNWQEFMQVIPKAPFTRETSWALWRGVAAVRIGDLDFGEQILRDLVVSDPDSVPVNAATTYVFNELGEFQETERYAETARMAAKRNLANTAGLLTNYSWNAYYTVGHVYLESGQLHDAEDMLLFNYVVLSNLSSSTGYNNFIYRTYIPLWDLSPTLEWGILSPELEADYQWLASKLETDGDLEKANQIRQWLEIQQANTLIFH